MTLLKDPNKNSLVTYIYSLLTKYNINLSVKQIALYAKNRWKKLITNKINEKANIMYLNESNKLRRLNNLNKFKKSIKLEKTEKNSCLKKITTSILSYSPIQTFTFRKYVTFLC